VPVVLNWWATEGGSGLASYGLQHSVDGGAFTDVALPSETSATTTLSVEAGKTHHFQVRAQDGAGNWSAWQPGVPFAVDLRQESHQDIYYTGAWQLQPAPTASGGHLKYASASGARATFTFTGKSVGWVASTGSNRGKAEVWLDGEKVRTVDLYAPTAEPRKIIFSGAWPFMDPLSTHTLEIRVLGAKNASSSGRRVDVDAFVVLR
jgi:hypothetical protein